MAIVTMVELTCGNCGVTHCIPNELYETYKREGGFWHCPNGHRRGFTEGSLNRENERLKQQLAEKDDAINRAREDTHRAQMELRRAQKRAAAGVCPCCQRTVSQLARHVKTAHPEYAKEHLGSGGKLPDDKVVSIRGRRKRA